MIDFYTSATPNGRKIAIMLEEARLDYVAGWPFVLDRLALHVFVQSDVPAGPALADAFAAVLRKALPGFPIDLTIRRDGFFALNSHISRASMSLREWRAFSFERFEAERELTLFLRQPE